MANKIGILVHFDQDLIDELNEISSQLGISRSELIRRSLGRDIQFVKEVELKGLRVLMEDSTRTYRQNALGA